MKKYDFIFVVLVYRNYDDFQNFYESLVKTMSNFKIIIVDSYFNEVITAKGKEIAKKNDCDFISVPNNGYGYGNNEGVEYALSKYKFDFLIISNPDVEIIHFPQNVLTSSYKNMIIGPSIITPTGKQQNPLYYRKNKFAFYLLKKYAFSEKISYLRIYLIVNKIQKFFRMLFNRHIETKVYSLHGSFLIIGIDALQKLIPLYDDKMFLYGEENHLAEKAREKNIENKFDKRFEVFHKEDSSSEGISLNVKAHTLNSLKIFFDNWDK